MKTASKYIPFMAFIRVPLFHSGQCRLGVETVFWQGKIHNYFIVTDMISATSELTSLYPQFDSIGALKLKVGDGVKCF